MIKMIPVDNPEQVPKKIDGNSIYRVGIDSNDWLAVMACPCGCGANIWLALLPDDSPRWNLSVDANGGATLSPSVNRIVGCKSHYFLRGGEIIWC